MKLRIENSKRLHEFQSDQIKECGFKLDTFSSPNNEHTLRDQVQLILLIPNIFYQDRPNQEEKSRNS